jgi:hypothetical protein
MRQDGHLPVFSKSLQRCRAELGMQLSDAANLNTDAAGLA